LQEVAKVGGEKDWGVLEGRGGRKEVKSNGVESMAVADSDPEDCVPEWVEVEGY
jgi:hypothetical protein